MSEWNERAVPSETEIKVKNGWELFWYAYYDYNDLWSDVDFRLPMHDERRNFFSGKKSLSSHTARDKPLIVKAHVHIKAKYIGTVLIYFMRARVHRLTLRARAACAFPDHVQTPSSTNARLTTL